LRAGPGRSFAGRFASLQSGFSPSASHSFCSGFCYSLFGPTAFIGELEGKVRVCLPRPGTAAPRLGCHAGYVYVTGLRGMIPGVGGVCGVVSGHHAIYHVFFDLGAKWEGKWEGWGRVRGAG
jgi:hypothetical protein